MSDYKRISILDWGPDGWVTVGGTPPEAPEPPTVENEEKEWPWLKGPPKDMVNSPSHYGTGSIECIDYIEDFLTTEEFIGYLRGNIAKYLHRWRYKNKEEDLLKAQWYLNRLIGVQQKTPKVYYQEG